jgi:hypothetical protein
VHPTYFFVAEPLPVLSFKIEVDAAAGFGFSAFGFFGSRLLLFWPLAMIVSSIGPAQAALWARVDSPGQNFTPA